ncbi:MAG TPA: nucleoside-triphosphatase [Bacteroidales bacterium]|nr:nucleoside-triphosphatase [Bacteroidales bacterium]
MSNRRLSEKWIKASIIGTIWAASEIVLGSFLHNLRVPFSSNFLTGIGIIIMISTSYKWKERGLFWRAGLICALMKTMSPSAVIFGPMVAIFSQSVMLELFTRVFGRNAVGYLTGAMFAMTWNLFQKIMNFIIYYGFNIANIYADLLKYAERQLNIDFDLVWSPIFALAAIYATLGVIAGIAGMMVGRRLVREPAAYRLGHARKNNNRLSPDRQQFNYSVSWLFLNIVLIITAFFLLNYAGWPVWSIAITAIVIVWILRYKRALRQLSRPRIWIFFVIITMATSFVIGKIQSDDWIRGLEIGIQMNFRAMIVILGFSVMGTELYNRKVREFFARTAFRQLPFALEISMKSLPMTIASVPEAKVIARSPVSVICSVISQIEQRLTEVKKELSRHIYIITGAIGEGKTTQVRKLVEQLKAGNVSVMGIYSPRIMVDGQTAGYDVVDVDSGLRVPFLRVDSKSESKKIGRYSINPAAIEAGLKSLSAAMDSNPDVIVADEIGKMELGNEGWFEKIDGMLKGSSILVFAVRDSFVEEIVNKFEMKDYSVMPVSEHLHLELARVIEERISSYRPAQ